MEPSACPLCGGELRPSGVSAIDRLVTGGRTVLGARVQSMPLRGDRSCAARMSSAIYGERLLWAFYGTTGRRRGLLESAREPTVAARRAAVWPLAVRRTRRTGPRPRRRLWRGELLAHYARLGWPAFGIEPSAAAAERRVAAALACTRERSRTSRGITLRSISIVFSHSLEHIPDPLDALRAARALLTPEGSSRSTPNWRCWQLRAFRGRWFPLDLPRHLQHFSSRALDIAAAMTGLEVVAARHRRDGDLDRLQRSLCDRGTLDPGWRLWLSYAIGAAVYPAVAGSTACSAPTAATRCFARVNGIRPG